MTMTLDTLLALKASWQRPTVVCLCGSTRFVQAFADATLTETLSGKIVLSIGCNTKSDDDLVRAGVTLCKEDLDILHLYKIDLSDEILVLNVGRYVGESTCREVEYARRTGKTVRWLEPPQDTTISPTWQEAQPALDAREHITSSSGTSSTQRKATGMNVQAFIEHLAEKEHARWARWMTYLFCQCEQQADGSLLIPSTLVSHWRKEIETPYSHLPERSKQSDRNQVAHILPIIDEYRKKAQ